MKKIKSSHGLEFDNILACVLDNQTDEFKFKELFRFLRDFDNKAVFEWCNKRNFPVSLDHIVATLKDIGKLK
jgi:hypothetical protein